MKINIANIERSELQALLKLLKITCSNTKNIYNTQLVTHHDGGWRSVGYINHVEMEIRLEDMKHGL